MDARRISGKHEHSTRITSRQFGSGPASML